VAVAAAIAWWRRRPPFQRVPDGDVDDGARAVAVALADRILAAWREGRFESLGDEAADRLRASLDPDRQRRAFEGIQQVFGEYVSASWTEAWTALEEPGARIHRLRAVFSAGDPEVRVVLDDGGKLTGFWVKHWRADLS